MTTAESTKVWDRLFIGGKWVQSTGTESFDVIDPATEKLFKRLTLASEADIRHAIGAAREAFDNGPWPRLKPTERAAYVERLADGLASRAEEIADLWSHQVGITYAAALPEVEAALRPYRHYAALASAYRFTEEFEPTSGEGTALLVSEPVGVVGAIVPWNYPLGLTANKVAPALIAGCSVVLKPPPEAPGEALILAEVAEEIGFPPGVINVVTAGREVSEILVSAPRVDKISFTGSTAAGRRIASVAGGRIARMSMELGGKSAAVVLDDFDPTAAANLLAGGATFLSGQICSSLTRVIISRNRHDDMVDALSTRFAQITVGDPFDPDTDMGPLAMERQRDTVEAYIAQGRSDGAQLAFGGKRPAHLGRGFYIEPTVFGNVHNSSTIAQEEIFGPVVCVIPVDDVDAAVEVANDTIYGLNSSVFTNDSERAYAIARRIRSGTVSQSATSGDVGVSFGGFKQSGLGREGGLEGLRSYLELKTILLRT
ncbi:aldehyde dehydrogenase [Rhodococcus koreensis]